MCEDIKWFPILRIPLLSSFGCRERNFKKKNLSHEEILQPRMAQLRWFLNTRIKGGQTTWCWLAAPRTTSSLLKNKLGSNSDQARDLAAQTQMNLAMQARMHARSLKKSSYTAAAARVFTTSVWLEKNFDGIWRIYSPPANVTSSEDTYVAWLSGESSFGLIRAGQGQRGPILWQDC